MRKNEKKIIDDLIRNHSTSIAGIVREINNIIDITDDKNCSAKFSKWLKIKLSEITIKCNKTEEKLSMIREKKKKDGIIKT